jgi:rare lipoprotein A
MMFASPHACAGDWLTSVSMEAPAVRAKDIKWTAVVIAAAGRPLTTGSVARRADTYTPAGGIKLTGQGHALDGIASYYWQEQKTATGETFNKRALTAAHRTLPFGTQVKVTRVDTGASVVVRINDRGPFKPGRVIDLSERAAEEIRMTGRGLANVKLEVLE